VSGKLPIACSLWELWGKWRVEAASSWQILSADYSEMKNNLNIDNNATPKRKKEGV
jgi:hypothetical protein